MLNAAPTPTSLCPASQTVSACNYLSFHISLSWWWLVFAKDSNSSTVKLLTGQSDEFSQSARILSHSAEYPLLSIVTTDIERFPRHTLSLGHKTSKNYQDKKGAHKSNKPGSTVCGPAFFFVSNTSMLEAIGKYTRDGRIPRKNSVHLLQCKFQVKHIWA